MTDDLIRWIFCPVSVHHLPVKQRLVFLAVNRRGWKLSDQPIDANNVING